MRGAEGFRRWLDQHPMGADVDVAASVKRGQQLYRNWLIARSVVAIMLGIGIIAVAVALRTGGPGAVATLTAHLDVEPSSGQAPLAVTADGSGSTSGGGGAIVSYRFDFDDRGGSLKPGDGPVADWEYRRPGTYTVRLTVSDASGAVDEDMVTVTVTDGPAALQALLVVEPSSGQAPLAVTADGSGSTSGGGGPIVSYRFDFDDRGGSLKPGDEPVADWEYRRPGTYTVRLTVTDATGAVDDGTATVTVTAPPTTPETTTTTQKPAPSSSQPR
jgi:PKD repeat protein